MEESCKRQWLTPLRQCHDWAQYPGTRGICSLHAQDALALDVRSPEESGDTEIHSTSLQEIVSPYQVLCLEKDILGQCAECSTAILDLREVNIENLIAPFH